ncbi:hypothetical protein [Polluticoccus soli]|uniref:hypothetical protein n=1 Tax=Polluticoccus soli TaxID=3034150 RepID=UPI0023E0BF63|nr:hypothetical protein [Flavipsychrobacter sp. JY13-12]
MMLFVLHFVVVFGAKHSQSGRIGKINELMLHKIDKEVVIFGASEGETGIAAPILEKKLGKPTFNLAMDGSSISQFGDLINEYNSYSKKGHYVILALGVFCLHDRELPKSPNWYYPWAENGFISTNYLLNRTPEFRRYKNFPPYGFIVFNAGLYRSSFDGWISLFTNRNENTCYEGNGWMPYNLTWGQNNTLQQLTMQHVFLNENIFTQYRKVVENLNAKGRKVILVFMPSWKGARSYYDGYDKLITKFKSLEGDHNVFLDYSNANFSANKDYFYNYTHLNKKGAELFTDTLASDIEKVIIADEQKAILVNDGKNN